jgi:hypothetical protein
LFCRFKKGANILLLYAEKNKNFSMPTAKLWILLENKDRHSCGSQQIEPELKWIVVPAQDSEAFQTRVKQMRGFML